MFCTWWQMEWNRGNCHTISFYTTCPNRRENYQIVAKWWLPISTICRSHTVPLQAINTLRPKRNGQHFADDIFKRIFFNESVWISIKISLKFVPKGPIDNIPSLVQIMAWRRPGDKPLSEPMMDSLPTHICVTRTQWVNVPWGRWRVCRDFQNLLPNGHLNP